jgi:hypothetical protein
MTLTRSQDGIQLSSNRDDFITESDGDGAVFDRHLGNLAKFSGDLAETLDDLSLSMN